jgi:hypothetical protein
LNQVAIAAAPQFRIAGVGHQFARGIGDVLSAIDALAPLVLVVLERRHTLVEALYTTGARDDLIDMTV